MMKLLSGLAVLAVIGTCLVAGNHLDDEKLSSSMEGRDDDTETAKKPFHCAKCIMKAGTTPHDDWDLCDPPTDPKTSHTCPVKNKNGKVACVGVHYIGGGIAFGCDSDKWDKKISAEIQQEMDDSDSDETEYLIVDTNYGKKLAMVTICYHNKCLPDMSTKSARYCRVCGFLEELDSRQEQRMSPAQKRIGRKKSHKSKARKSSPAEETLEGRGDDTDSVETDTEEYSKSIATAVCTKKTEASSYAICKDAEGTDDNENDCMAIAASPPKEAKGLHSVYGCKSMIEKYAKNFDGLDSDLIAEVSEDEPVCKEFSAQYQDKNATREICACSKNMCDPFEQEADAAASLSPVNALLAILLASMWIWN